MSEHYIDSLSDIVAPAIEPTKIKEEDNVIFVIAGQIGLEAIEDKIILLLDPFKSGYECKDCDGTGTYKACECLRAGRELGVNVNGRSCSFRDACSRQVVGSTCNTCKGHGSTLVLPEKAKSMPTTGVIVSIGPHCKIRKIGERMLFGAHTGYALPFKGNARLRCMREDEPLCKIYAIDSTMSLGDFISIEEFQD